MIPFRVFQDDQRLSTRSQEGAGRGVGGVHETMPAGRVGEGGVGGDRREQVPCGELVGSELQLEQARAAAREPATGQCMHVAIRAAGNARRTASSA